jgi:hypothetical protein
LSRAALTAGLYSHLKETSMASPTDLEPIQSETTESNQVSRLKRYDQRIEEWITSLKDEAGQRSPGVLSGLAAKAKDVAAYLDKLAERARSKSDAPGSSPPSEQALRSDESTTATDRDPTT